MAKKAVVLLSGGVDSTTILAIAQSQGYDVYTMSFRYGQRHVLELDNAKRISEKMGVKKHVIIDIDLRAFGGSALTDDIDVPKERSDQEIGTGIPITYVPCTKYDIPVFRARLGRDVSNRHNFHRCQRA